MHIGCTVYAMLRKKLNYSLSEIGRAQNPLLKVRFLRKSVPYYSKKDKSKNFRGFSDFFEFKI